MQRVIIVGPGKMSKEYVRVIKDIKNIDITGVVGRDYNKTKKYAIDFNIPHYGINLSRVAKKANGTIALICTPNSTHYDGVLEAANLGLHVLCEKPLHIIPEKQNKMIQICRKNRIKLGVAFLYKFLNHMLYVKNMLDSDKLGKILVIDARMKIWRNSDYYLKSSWHGDPKVDGGGPFMQQGPHLLDLALWLGNGFKEVIAAKRFILYHPIKVEDHGYAIIHYGNNAVGIIEVSTISKEDDFAKRNIIEINSTKGSIVLDLTGIKKCNINGLDIPQFEEKLNSRDYLLKQLILDFCNAIEEDKEPFTNGESGKIVVELINEIYKISGNPIKLKQ